MTKKSLILPAIVVLIIAGYFVWKGGYLTKKGTDTTASSVQGNSANPSQQSLQALTSIAVYKTKADYSNDVSVTLSFDGSKVASYPAPSDVEGQTPIALPDGYHVGRMIGAGQPNGAFLNISISDYASMPASSITPDYLLAHVADKSPFTEIYNCTAATTPSMMVNDISGWINNSQLAQMCPRAL